MQAAKIILRSIAAAAVMGIYLLPDTVWTAEVRDFPILAWGCVTIVQCIVVMTAITLIWLTYFYVVRDRDAKAQIWWLVLIYIGVYGVSMLAVKAGVPVLIGCSLVLMSFGAGLLAARLCSSPELTTSTLGLVGAAQASYAIYTFILTSQHRCYNHTRDACATVGIWIKADMNDTLANARIQAKVLLMNVHMGIQLA